MTAHRAEHAVETQCRVLGVSVSGFYASPLGANEIRIAYVLKEADLRHSVELLKIALERYNKR